MPTRRQGSRCGFQPRELTNLEWWFTFFAFLRHDIAHGEEISPRQHEWNAQSHLFLGESRLRQAIKQTVANAGHPTVLLDPYARIAQKYAALFQEDGAAPSP